MLLIDGRLNPLLAMPGQQRDPARLLDDALNAAFGPST
jgi:hypothetical protein